MNTPQDFAKAGIDSVSFFGNTALDGIERVAALNLSAARSFVEATFSNLSALMGAKDVQSLVSMQKELAAPTIEQGMAYSRNVYAIATETKDKMAKEVEAQVATAKANVEGLVEKTLAAAPAGSEAAVAAVKSAIKTANEAYEGLNKAAKQATEVAQASVVATVEATKAAAPKAVKKAA
ncbi:MAG: phasin family protein [Rhodocyclaceae bacterium]|nr:phasin family protein [Rhodocyclaceae bacterium]